MRTMTVEKLLKGMPILQSQIDALLDFEVSLESFLFIIYIWTPRHPVCLSGQVQPKDLNNRVINACFLLLFKDLIKLYACYNDGIINLLGRSVSLKSVRGITGIESHILAALPHQKSSSRWREASVKTGWRSTSGSWHGWRGFRSSLKSRRWNPDLIPHTAAVTSVSCWIQPALFFFSPFTANGDRQKRHSWTHSGKNHEGVQIDHQLRSDRHVDACNERDAQTQQRDSRVNIGLMKMESCQNLSLKHLWNDGHVRGWRHEGNYSLHKSAVWSYKLHVSRWSH